MKKNSKSLLLALALFGFTAQAQNINVKGTITDESTGEVLPYASVMVKGTQTWTTSDMDGVYSLSAPANGVLSVDLLGYETAEVEIGGKSTVNIALKLSFDQLASIKYKCI